MTLLGLGLVAILATAEAFVLWRYPDFRRGFMAHWRPEAVAERMEAWARRSRGDR